MKNFLHDLFYSHPLLTLQGVGVVHACVNRLTSKANVVIWYPEGYSDKIDITWVDPEEFFSCKSVKEAYRLVEEDA